MKFGGHFGDYEGVRRSRSCKVVERTSWIQNMYLFCKEFEVSSSSHVGYMLRSLFWVNLFCLSHGLDEFLDLDVPKHYSFRYGLIMGSYGIKVPTLWI